MQVTPTEISASAQVTRTAGTMRCALDAMVGDINQPLCVAVAAGIMPAWVPVRVAALVSSRNNSNDDGNETQRGVIGGRA
jgi:hypothetical protein